MPKVQNAKFHFYNMSAICTFVSFWQSKKDDKGNIAQNALPYLMIKSFDLKSSIIVGVLEPIKKPRVCLKKV